MRRLKTIYELRTTNRPQKKYTEPKDPVEPKRNHTYDPERLSDNGTLDIFLHRVRVEMLNADKHKQDKQDNLTRKERLALRELVTYLNLTINITCKSKEQQWVRKWHQHMQIYLWEN